MMRFTFTVTVEVAREYGLFASRDELSEEIGTAIQDADPGTISTSAGAEYRVDTWQVDPCS